MRGQKAMKGTATKPRSNFPHTKKAQRKILRWAFFYNRQ